MQENTSPRKFDPYTDDPNLRRKQMMHEFTDQTNWLLGEDSYKGPRTIVKTKMAVCAIFEDQDLITFAINLQKAIPF